MKKDNGFKVFPLSEVWGKSLLTAGAFALAAVLMFTACPPPTGENPAGEQPPAEQSAEQLAAAINKISAGSATVNGATVTLSGKLSLESQFTVPAGVTLDLTGDGELALRNAALTVNGTVKTGPQSIRLEDNAEWGTINGSGTIYLKSKGSLLYIGDNRTLTLDGVTLVGVKDNNRPLVEVVGDIENGYMGKFIMKNGAITGNTFTDDDWADGGGVALWGGTFIMEGGTISGNSAAGSRGSGGGGVAVSGEAFSGKPGGTFIMEGGVIFGNSAGEGGGVKVVHNGLFTLKGGRIQGGTDSDGFTKNRNTDNGNSAALCVVWGGRAVWGTGGTYTGGYSQAAGTSIVVEMNPNNGWGGTDDTLIAAADGGDPSAEAAQLAAAINKISAGSATVNGATVTLTGKVSLESQFTVPVGVTLAVPAGVTLDLTGDGGLALRNAALTVNGTVNAGPQSIRLDAERGTIDGSGTIQLKGKGGLLDIHDNRTLTLDGVTLAGVADNSVALVAVGHGGAFIMKSGAVTGNINIGDASGGGVRVSNGGTFTMKGGAISGNTVQGGAGTAGGGVAVSSSTFIMEGGAIFGNTAKDDGNGSGGGVKLSDGSTFTMKGGTISDNSAGNDSGGVCVERGCSFIMEGGAITGTSARVAGGVKVNLPSDDAVVNGGSFTMKGGEITGNSALGSSGGGVKVYGGAVGEGGTFTMEGGAITDNSAASGGGGVAAEGDTAIFIMKSGVISGNSTSRSGGGVAVSSGDGGTFTMKGGVIFGNSAANGGGVRINENAIFTMTGGTISDNSAEGGDYAEGGGVSVSKGIFIMQNGTITGNTVTSDEFARGGGVFVGGEGATFTMTGSTILENTAGEGGGVLVGEGATFTMTDSTISENTANGAGGGVLVGFAGPTLFTMESGAITDNTVTGDDLARGGGGGGLVVHEGCTFILKGGVISGNSASGMGGGVEIYKGAFTMQGGTISGNTTAFSGGGVEVRGGGATFTMEGGAISGNTAQGEWAAGGGVRVDNGNMFTMKGGTIYGKTSNLPLGADPSLANSGGNKTAALSAGEGAAKWGTGGTYTKGGVDKAGGSDIGSTDDTLIAIPAAP
jgi:hypothetical protein